MCARHDQLDEPRAFNNERCCAQVQGSAQKVHPCQVQPGRRADHVTSMLEIDMRQRRHCRWIAGLFGEEGESAQCMHCWALQCCFKIRFPLLVLRNLFPTLTTASHAMLHGTAGLCDAPFSKPVCFWPVSEPPFHWSSCRSRLCLKSTSQTPSTRCWATRHHHRRLPLLCDTVLFTLMQNNFSKFHASFCLIQFTR